MLRYTHHHTLLTTHCRTLAEQMGGSISFTDNVPRGTVMVLRIPQQQASAAAAAAAAAAATAAAAAAAAAATAAAAEAPPAAAGVSSAEQTRSSFSSCEESTELPQPPLSQAAVAENERLLRTKRVLVRATHLLCLFHSLNDSCALLMS
jgi:pyruvate/2-oxoglutarate dehydrogenase complex dihydrolipoamide acyltransferase (E2) component